MKARAAILYAKHEPLRIETVEVREPRDKEVIVKVVSSGICGTEHAYQDDIWDIDFKMPVVLGHEGAGIVEKIGSAVTKVKVGDHVVIGKPCCGKCPACLEGKTWLCEGSMDFSLLSGGYDFYGTAPMKNEQGEDVYQLFEQGSLSEYVCIYEPMLTVISPDDDLRLMGPLGCGFGTGAGAVYSEIKPLPEQWIVITGAGPVGLAAMWMANAMGARTLIIDVKQNRVDQAKELGATEAINTAGMSEEQITAAIKDIVGYRGSDGLVETTGVEMVIKATMKALKHGCTCAQVSAAPNVFFSNYINECNDGRKVHFIRYGNQNTDDFVPLMIQMWKDGKFPFDKLVSFYTLDEAQKAIDDSTAGIATKPIVLMNKEDLPK